MTCDNCEHYSLIPSGTTYHQNPDGAITGKHFLSLTGAAYVCKNPNVVNLVEFPKKIFVERVQLTDAILVGQARRYCKRGNEP